ncbi:MAG: EAL domain-containing protein [Candidatus Thiodiazotropha taylori]|nr:EAL domain-containing protein [Candidatus Thiodiazotropha taylori]
MDRNRRQNGPSILAKSHSLILVFTALGITLGILIGTYWYLTLEPRLVAHAQSQANTLAQAQATILSKPLSIANQALLELKLTRAMDSILLIRDSSIESPLIQRIEIEVDSTMVNVAPESFPLSRGKAECVDCFVSEVTLFHEYTRSLIGIARIYTGRDFIDNLINNVQQKLLISSIILMLLLILAWATAEWLLSKLRQSQSNLQLIIDSVADPLFVYSTESDLLLKNKAAESLVSSELMMNGNIGSPDYLPPREMISSVIRKGRSIKYIHTVKRSHGKPQRMELQASPLSIDDTMAVVITYRDITEHLEIVDELQIKKQQLQQLAEKDSLTQLPNRFLFTKLLNQAISRADRTNSLLAILFLDLDRFKEVNDSLGHDAGDELLITTANRLLHAIRSGDVVARLSGDEFVILLENTKRTEDASSVARHIIKTIRQPVTLQGKRIQPAVSIGISIYPNDGKDGERLLQNADTAMYRAKRQGRNTFRLYNTRMTESIQERINVITELETATEENNFVMLYQPQIDLYSKKLIGVEALLRWKRTDDDLVSPYEFLDLAEEMGLTHLIGQWVLYNVCLQTAQWHSDNLAPPRVSINISASELLHDDFLTNVENILHTTGCAGEWLAMEVTENLFIQRLDEAAKRLQRLKEMGISIVIDDFGIGYSSLARLKKLPIDLLKLDKVFLENLNKDSGNLAIVQTVVDMGQRLGIEVLAEGVETAEQETLLILSDYRIAQGYRYGKPIAAEHFRDRLLDS